MIISAKKIKPIEKNKPKITLKNVFQSYRQSSQKDKQSEPNKNKRGNVKNTRKAQAKQSKGVSPETKKKNKSKY